MGGPAVKQKQYPKTRNNLPLQHRKMRNFLVGSRQMADETATSSSDAENWRKDEERDGNGGGAVSFKDGREQQKKEKKKNLAKRARFFFREKERGVWKVR